MNSSHHSQFTRKLTTMIGALCVVFALAAGYQSCKFVAVKKRLRATKGIINQAQTREYEIHDLDRYWDEVFSVGGSRTIVMWRVDYSLPDHSQRHMTTVALDGERGIGDEVKVLYDPLDPNFARADAVEAIPLECLVWWLAAVLSGVWFYGRRFPS